MIPTDVALALVLRRRGHSQQHPLVITRTEIDEAKDMRLVMEADGDKVRVYFAREGTR